MTLGEALHELGRILELYKGTVYLAHPGVRGPTTTVRVEALALLYGAYRDLEPRMRAAEISEAGAQRREADARELLAAATQGFDAAQSLQASEGERARESIAELQRERDEAREELAQYKLEVALVMQAEKPVRATPPLSPEEHRAVLDMLSEYGDAMDMDEAAAASEKMIAFVREMKGKP